MPLILYQFKVNNTMKFNANNYYNNSIKYNTLVGIGLKPPLSKSVIFIRNINILATINISNFKTQKESDMILFCSSIVIYENLDLVKINDNITYIKNNNVEINNILINNDNKLDKKLW